MTEAESQMSEYDLAGQFNKTGGKMGDMNNADAQSQGNERAMTAATSVDADNPFKAPSDELIFTFKEDEK
jgi:hypothetical protein